MINFIIRDSLISKLGMIRTIRTNRTIINYHIRMRKIIKLIWFPHFTHHSMSLKITYATTPKKTCHLYVNQSVSLFIVTINQNTHQNLNLHRTLLYHLLAVLWYPKRLILNFKLNKFKRNLHGTVIFRQLIPIIRKSCYHQKEIFQTIMREILREKDITQWITGWIYKKSKAHRNLAVNPLTSHSNSI